MVVSKCEMEDGCICSVSGCRCRCGHDSCGRKRRVDEASDVAVPEDEVVDDILDKGDH